LLAKAPQSDFAKYQIGNLLSGVEYDPKDVAACRISPAS
jgi:hypothetical protein